MTITARVERLEAIVRQLGQLETELAQLLRVEHDTRVRAYAMSQETSVSARERASEIATLASHLDIIDRKGDIAMLLHEKDMLMLLIDRGL